MVLQGPLKSVKAHTTIFVVWYFEELSNLMKSIVTSHSIAHCDYMYEERGVCYVELVFGIHHLESNPVSD